MADVCLREGDSHSGGLHEWIVPSNLQALLRPGQDTKLILCEGHAAELLIIWPRPQANGECACRICSN